MDPKHGKRKDLADDSDDEDEFFTEKGGRKKKSGERVEEGKEEEEEDQILPPLSKKAIRKIRAEGPYGGKNIVRLDAEGKAIKKSEYDSSYLDTLRNSSNTPKNSDGTKMQIMKDEELGLEADNPAL